MDLSKMQLPMVQLLLLLLLLPAFLHSQSDIECLKEFKNSVQAAGEYLQSWDFGSSSGSGKSGNASSAPPNICNFIGVQCLHPSEIKVYSLSLPGAGLRGTFPRGLDKCSSLTGLDLSSNALTGPIPPNICQMLPYLVKLDLSQNNLTGSIPEGLATCVYLNELRLQRNALTGGIPGQIGLLSRLRDFDVANNRLAGAIPYSFSTRPAAGSVRPAGFPAAAFEGNDGLCGTPLKKACGPGTGGGAGGARRRRAKAGAAVIAGVAVGGTVALLVATTICIWIMVDRLRAAGGGAGGGSGGDDPADMLDNAWLRRLVPATIVVSMFEQPLVKIRLVDLAAATGGFAREAVIGCGRTGVFYRATLRDGSMLAIKRLRRSLLLHGGSEKHFRGEMDAMSRVRHRNLVPLLGYCIAGPDRLLIYKHLSGGALRERLYGCNEAAALDWNSRLRVAVGAARGLAWLHHSCSPRLVHRCITSSSILLDEDLEPRITDFGLARLMNMNTTRAMVTAPSTTVTETSSSTDARLYVAPEEISFSSATAPSATSKGDVYSFGVVLLELVTGRRPSDGGEGGRSLVEWIGDLFKTGHVSEAIDKRLVAAEAAALAAAAAAADGCMSDNSSSGSGKRREVMQVLKIACSCVLSFPKERPSMYEVYHMLRGVGEDYYGAAPAQAALVRRHPHIRQVEDEGDIAAASAALARNGEDHYHYQQQAQQQQQQVHQQQQVQQPQVHQQQQLQQPQLHHQQQQVQQPQVHQQQQLQQPQLHHQQQQVQQPQVHQQQQLQQPQLHHQQQQVQQLQQPQLLQQQQQQVQQLQQQLQEQQKSEEATSASASGNGLQMQRFDT